jgi:cytochrome b pre-mRNA-processing protein 3
LGNPLPLDLTGREDRTRLPGLSTRGRAEIEGERMFGWARNGSERLAAGRLYASLVEQARRPEFYARLGVPDTLDGRFEVLTLHAYLALNRLKRDRACAAVAQALVDAFIDDMDANLREMGAGDLGVGRRVKTMATALYGRIAAYERALAAGPLELTAALARNLYGTTRAEPWQIAAIALYMRDLAEGLARQPAEALLRGEISLGPPPAAVAEGAGKALVV